ncbi:FHA domain-containing protein [Streptomyces sp. NPDC000594]|uniref:FHA domain-containing protein n=1 Tax=Streptomyces sp. NPDC000594 TaxID=3154261 RepID=UPI00332E67C1
MGGPRFERVPEPGQAHGPPPEEPPEQQEQQEQQQEPPAPAPGPFGEAAECWNCREPVAPAETHCPTCDAPRTHTVLSCPDLALELTHGPGAPLRLGRDPVWAPATAAAFGALPRISRRQAQITVDPDGSVWVEEPSPPSTNRTYVNGEPVGPGRRARLRDGDELRFGRRIVHFTVRVRGPGGPERDCPGG